jgi:SAM-dependent methyltransferase
VTSGVNEVRELFNRKAGGWEQKYRADGPLRSRLNRFGDCIERAVPRGGRVLDLGCGTGSLARYLSAKGYLVTACDIADKMIDEGVRTSLGTSVVFRLLKPVWNHLPFESNTFDAIVASSVFEYVHSVDEVLAECRRTLKPGGCIVLTAPDPKHYVRRAESLIRPIAVGALRLSTLGPLPRLTAYFQYLRASRNRMPAAAWRRAAAIRGLVTGTGWLDADSALLLMRFSKPAEESGIDTERSL